MVIGFLILLLGIINLRKLSGANQKSENSSVLFFGGIYRYIRHPVYLGIVILMFFYSLYVFSVFKLISTLLLVVLLYFKSKQEEENLISTYSEYLDYKKRTGRFFPKKNHNKS
jgi:protein-S-isoprenylcysteine O-methyltransferase Ste14